MVADKLAGGVTNQQMHPATRLWRMSHAVDGREWPQPHCGWSFLPTLSQGSAFRATLGCGQNPVGIPGRRKSRERFEREQSQVCVWVR
jgi:hypothetical protein